MPRVTLPIPMGATAAQTSADIEAARARTAFDPRAIEECLRDGRIDNEARHKVVATLDKDEVFGDWKKRMCVPGACGDGHRGGSHLLTGHT